jgi:putative transposase
MSCAVGVNGGCCRTSQWKYLYRPIDKAGQTIDFLLTAQRDKTATLRFFRKALRQHGLPEKVTIDKSGANTAALEALQEETGATIEIRQNKYLNNLVEQDHRAVKRIVRPMLGFKSFSSARPTLAGLELMHMLKKGQRCAPWRAKRGRGRDRNTARATVGPALAVSAFPRYVPV